MFRCNNCGSEVNENARFCSQCGKELLVNRCSNCDAEVDENARFCSQCGNALSTNISDNCETKKEYKFYKNEINDNGTSWWPFKTFVEYEQYIYCVVKKSRILSCNIESTEDFVLARMDKNKCDDVEILFEFGEVKNLDDYRGANLRVSSEGILSINIMDNRYECQALYYDIKSRKMYKYRYITENAKKKYILRNKPLIFFNIHGEKYTIYEYEDYKRDESDPDGYLICRTENGEKVFSCRCDDIVSYNERYVYFKVMKSVNEQYYVLDMETLTYQNIQKYSSKLKGKKIVFINAKEDIIYYEQSIDYSSKEIIGVNLKNELVDCWKEPDFKYNEYKHRTFYFTGYDRVVRATQENDELALIWLNKDGTVNKSYSADDTGSHGVLFVLGNCVFTIQNQPKPEGNRGIDATISYYCENRQALVPLFWYSR